MTFFSSRKSQESKSVSSDVTTKSHGSHKSNKSGKNQNDFLEIVNSKRIIEILTTLQSFSKDIEFDGEGKEKYVSFLQNYKTLIQKFNIIIVDPQEIFDDFWNKWNEFADLIDVVLPPDNFQNVIDFSSEQLQRSRQCFKQAKKRLIKIRPKCDEKFDYVIGLINDLIEFIFAVKKPTSILTFQANLNECNNSISTYVTPYYKKVLKIHDQKQLETADPNLLSSLQYYNNAISFFKQVIQIVKTFNDTHDKRNQFITNIEFYGRELSLLVPESLKTITISQIMEKKKKINQQRKEKEGKKQIKGSLSLTSINSNDSNYYRQQKQLAEIDQEPLQYPLYKKDRKKLTESLSISITPKGLRTKTASEFVKSQLAAKKNKLKQAKPPKESSTSDDDYDLDDGKDFSQSFSSSNEHIEIKKERKEVTNSSSKEQRKKSTSSSSNEQKKSANSSSDDAELIERIREKILKKDKKKSSTKHSRSKIKNISSSSDNDSDEDIPKQKIKQKPPPSSSSD